MTYTVTFSEAVTGVDVSDFTLSTTGTAAGVVSGVSGSGAVYSVTVGSITGEGTLRLRLNASGTGIVDIANTEITGGFAGQIHPVDRVPPPPATFTTPTDGAVLTDNRQRFEGTAPGAVFVRLQIFYPGGFIVGSRPVDASGNWSSISPTNILPEGPIEVRATATDAFNDAATTTIFIFVDSIAPGVSSLTAPDDGTYGAGSAMDLVLNFNEAVTVDTTGGSPRIPLTIGSSTAHASYVSGSGSTALVFRYVVQSGDNDADGITVNQPEANGAVIRDAAGNDAVLTVGSFPSTANVLVDGVFPFVTAVTPPAMGTYVTGQTLGFEVRFNETVLVDTSLGRPTLSVDIGGRTVEAGYVSGSGTDTLIFTYEVEDGDLDGDGISVVALSAAPGAIADQVGQAATLTLAGIGPTTGVLVDADRPGVTLIAPTTQQRGPFTVTVTFSEPVTGFEIGDIAVTNGTLSGFTGSGATYAVTVTPGADEFVTLQVIEAAAQDAAGNPSTASAPLSVEAASVRRDFEAASEEIRKIIVDQALRDLRARIAATERVVRAAQDRLAADAPPVDRALSFQGTLQADDLSLSSKGSFGADTGLANGTRRILSGEFSLTRDAEGTTSARLDATLAWERRLSDDALAAWFLGLEVGHAGVERSFSGPLRSLGVSLGAYGVQRLDENLYLRGFASATVGRNDLRLSNGILALQSDYTTRSVQAGISLSGVLPMDGWELRPELRLAAGRTWLGTLDLTGSAYGQTAALQLDAGQVTLGMLTFQPEFLVPLDGRPVAEALSLARFAPGLTCETVSGVEDWSKCGVALGLGVSHQSGDGRLHLEVDVNHVRVGPRRDTSLGLSLEHRF